MKTLLEKNNFFVLSVIPIALAAMNLKMFNALEQIKALKRELKPTQEESKS